MEGTLKSEVLPVASIEIITELVLTDEIYKWL